MEQFQDQLIDTIRNLEQELERVKEDLRVETNVRKSFEKAFERVKAENKDQIKTILEFRQIESDYISECLEKAAEIERLKLIISGKYLLINGKEVL